MDPINLIVKYSFITNKLRYCGPHDSYLNFLNYLINPSEELKDKIIDELKRFEGLYPYLQLIAKKTNNHEFSHEVGEAYWLGSKLLDKFDEIDLNELIMSLTKRGLPKSYAEKIANGIPKGMVPHHSFNVIYVGVGKITGSVGFNIENINNCLIRPAEVIEIKEKSVVAKHRPYMFNNNKLILGKPIETEFDYMPEFVKLEKGEIISIHWNFVVDKLKQKEFSNLVNYTKINVDALNNSL
ncbi:hypothetical protein HN789_01455 [archaeon]|jgi:hypothetical protein|nr:hypothetical protein [archaeon]MBT4022198.1 hypothetical protein [archaeon]MBT4272811.1 hypothetical protein [archaeon]MBT4461610.1 hypothetical protein [archaeon]MBT4857622.1 hypothetical protein [archaeon]